MTTDTTTATPTPLTAEQAGASRDAENAYPHGGAAFGTFLYMANTGADLTRVGSDITAGTDPTADIAQTKADLGQMMQDYAIAASDLTAGIQGQGGLVTLPHQLVKGIGIITNAALGLGNTPLDASFGGALTQLGQAGETALVPKLTFT